MGNQSARQYWVPLVVALVSVAGGIITWSAAERARLAQEEYVRREARYTALLGAVHGFYIDTSSSGLRARFISELELAWLYCPDDVIRKGYRFLDTVRSGATFDDRARKTALGEFVLAVRRDLLSREAIKNTALAPSEFEILVPRVISSDLQE